MSIVTSTVIPHSANKVYPHSRWVAYALIVNKYAQGTFADNLESVYVDC